MVVRAQDGTTWAWDLTGSSVVRDDGTRTTESALAAGQLVFIGVAVVGAGPGTAQLIVIRRAPRPAPRSGCGDRHRLDRRLDTASSPTVAGRQRKRGRDPEARPRAR